jgi:hypothetical protein
VYYYPFPSLVRLRERVVCCCLLLFACFLVVFFALHPLALEALAHRQQGLGAVGGVGDDALVVDDEVRAAAELRGGGGAHDAALDAAEE